MYEVSVKAHFSAAHRLEGYKGSCENLHGHNWEVEVFVRGKQLDSTGLLVDFHDVKDAVRAALAKLDHSDLNVVPELKGRNPSSEHIAEHLYRTLRKSFGSKKLFVHRVKVQETPGNAVSFWEE